MTQRWLDVKESFLPAGVARLNWQKGPGTRTANEEALRQLRSDAERHGLAPTEIKELVDNATRRRQDSAPKAAQALDEMRRTGGLHTAADAANGLSTEGVVRLELAEALGADWVALVGGEEAAPGLVADGVAYLELLAKERWEGGLRAAALGGEYQPTAARPATLAALDEAAAAGDQLRLLPLLLLSNRRCGAPSVELLQAAMRACAANRPDALEARAPLEARVLRAVCFQEPRPEPGPTAVGRGSPAAAKGRWAAAVAPELLEDLKMWADLTVGTPGGGGGVVSATGRARGGDHAAGAYLLQYAADVALKKASGALSAALAAAALAGPGADADALADKVRAGADAAVNALLWPGRFERLGREQVISASAALKLAARTVPGAVGSVPTHELGELVLRVLGRSGVAELLAEVEVAGSGDGGGDGGPLWVGAEALLLVPRTGCCAVLEYLAAHGSPAVRSVVAGLPGDLRQRPGLMHACAGGGGAAAAPRPQRPSGPPECPPVARASRL